MECVEKDLKELGKAEEVFDSKCLTANSTRYMRSTCFNSVQHLLQISIP